MSVKNKVERAAAAVEAENVMARHSYYHAAGKHREEVESIWTKQPAASWTLAMAKMWTLDSFVKSYVDGNDAMVNANMRALCRKYPEVEGMDPHPLMEESVHMLTSPLIEVAGDAQSVKGVWYTPGLILSTLNPSGEKEARWTWERYAADFIMEDGKLVYKNLVALCDFAGDVDDSDWTVIEDNAGMALPEVTDENGEAVVPVMDAVGEFYHNYAPWQPAQLIPRLPTAYESLKDTFEYNDVVEEI